MEESEREKLIKSYDRSIKEIDIQLGGVYTQIQVADCLGQNTDRLVKRKTGLIKGRDKVMGIKAKLEFINEETEMIVGGNIV